MGPTRNRHTAKAHPVQVRCLSSPEQGERLGLRCYGAQSDNSRIQCKFRCSCGICRKLNTKRFLFLNALLVSCAPQIPVRMGSSKLAEERPLPHLSPAKSSLCLRPCRYLFALVDHRRFQSRWSSIIVFSSQDPETLLWAQLVAGLGEGIRVFILEELKACISRSSSGRVLLSSKGSRVLCSLWVACSLASLSSNSWRHCLIAVRTRQAALMGVNGPSNTSGILDGIHGVQLVGRSAIEVEKALHCEGLDRSTCRGVDIAETSQILLIRWVI